MNCSSSCSWAISLTFFFFQAEDGIRDLTVTGVQTCALPISPLGEADLFAEDAQVCFPKWGLANGKDEIGRWVSEVGSTLKGITHHFSEFNWIFSGTDVIVCEGTSLGQHQDGPWRAGDPEWGAGRWCDVFEIRDFKIQRCFIYLDPDYAGRDIERYPWLNDR